MLYELLFSLLVPISLDVQRYSPTILNLILLFESHFFYFHHLILNNNFILRYHGNIQLREEKTLKILMFFFFSP